MLTPWINAERMQRTCCKFGWCTMANNRNFTEFLEMCGGFMGTELTEDLLTSIASFIWFYTPDAGQRWTNAAELKALIAGNAGYISSSEDNVKFYDGGFEQ